jgi:hypothetical protein
MVGKLQGGNILETQIEFPRRGQSLFREFFSCRGTAQFPAIAPQSAEMPSTSPAAPPNIRRFFPIHTTIMSWQSYNQHIVRYPQFGFSLDLSLMDIAEDFPVKMEPKIHKAFADMKALEGGAIANPDEGRMVGHYWLRNADLAPTPELKEAITKPLAALKDFAAQGPFRRGGPARWRRVPTDPAHRHRRLGARPATRGRSDRPRPACRFSSSTTPTRPAWTR